ncbi:Signal recognition particle protein [Vanrija pseudolonga]|uniref:Signal recognition particle protein n=1 Tax=Vanrija pseudolonga TaxID=143232 RepID=A0AAF0YDE8_9TREE|nr:Signal recognition particle protein [Vanrija pseudolonga]
MVYIKTWTDFESAVIELYNRAPRQTRYVVKFIPKTGHLVLKVTDDIKCIKYKTFSAIILNRFESLNLRLLSSITNARRRAPLVVGSGSAGAGTPTAERDDPLKAGAAGSGSNTPQRKGTPAATAGGGATGGGAGKKKKKGKR